MSPLLCELVEKHLFRGEEEELEKSSSPALFPMAVKSTANLEFSPFQAFCL